MCATPAIADPSGQGGVGGSKRESISGVTFRSHPTPGALNSISAAYDASRRDRKQGQDVRKSFLSKAAAGAGVYYDAEAVDYLKLRRSGDVEFSEVELVVPRDYKVDEVHLEEGVEKENSRYTGRQVTASVAGTTGLGS